MANTYRKDRYGILSKRERDPKARYKCRCEYCSGLSKSLTCEKIAKKELKKEILFGEPFDMDIPKQDEILKQILGT